MILILVSTLTVAVKSRPMAGTLENRKADILEMANDTTTPIRDILFWLKQEGVKCSDKTLRRRLLDWGTPSRQATITQRSGDSYDYLTASIDFIYHHNITFSDAKIL
jgi:hypothetical protein